MIICVHTQEEEELVVPGIERHVREDTYSWGNYEFHHYWKAWASIRGEDTYVHTYTWGNYGFFINREKASLASLARLNRYNIYMHAQESWFKLLLVSMGLASLTQ